ncbi:hypothetical protein [Arthrobacter sp. UYEF21]|uniref:hypothetical protein n=1 Tax=Arthrobacter sp. UYEF21 TaxID=1756364 RepID=UPI003391194A
MIIAVLANAAEPFRAPLGIALGVLASTLLFAYVLNRSTQRQKLVPSPTPAGNGGHQAAAGKRLGKKSLSSELAVLAEGGQFEVLGSST